MKKCILWLSVFLFASIFFSGCSETIGTDEVITESTGQTFNSLNRYLFYELELQSGEKQDAVIMATIETDDNKWIEKEVYGATRASDQDIFDDFLSQFPDSEMKWTKSTIRVMPWNGSDFSSGDALLSIFAEVKEEITGEQTYAVVDFRKDSLTTSISQFNTYIFDSGDAGVMFASIFSLKENDCPYYEGIIYTLMPVDMKKFALGFTSKDFDVLESRVPKTIPVEGYLCWGTEQTN